MQHEIVTKAAPALFPWEDIDAIVREQAETEIWSDAEHDAWLEALFADQRAALDGGDPAYERWVAEGAPGVVWSSLGDDDVMADVWPAEYRDDWMGA